MMNLKENKPLFFLSRPLERKHSLGSVLFENSGELEGGCFAARVPDPSSTFPGSGVCSGQEQVSTRETEPVPEPRVPDGTLFHSH